MKRFILNFWGQFKKASYLDRLDCVVNILTIITILATILAGIPVIIKTLNLRLTYKQYAAIVAIYLLFSAFLVLLIGECIFMLKAFIADRTLLNLSKFLAWMAGSVIVVLVINNHAIPRIVFLYKIELLMPCPAESVVKDVNDITYINGSDASFIRGRIRFAREVELGQYEILLYREANRGEGLELYCVPIGGFETGSFGINKDGTFEIPAFVIVKNQISYLFIVRTYDRVPFAWFDQTYYEGYPKEISSISDWKITNCKPYIVPLSERFAATEPLKTR